MTLNTSKSLEICLITDLPDGSTNAFEIAEGKNIQKFFIVRKGKSIFAYLNSCPHTGSPLDWVPNQFLNKEKEYIMCATHGALFEIDTGKCVEGPCKGDKLNSLKASIIENKVFIHI